MSQAKANHAEEVLYHVEGVAWNLGNSEEDHEKLTQQGALEEANYQGREDDEDEQIIPQKENLQKHKELQG